MILWMPNYPLFNFSPNDKVFNWSKFADDKFKVSEILKFVLGKAENIVGKGENAGHQHFLFFPTMFSTGVFLNVVKSRDCLVQRKWITKMQ